VTRPRRALRLVGWVVCGAALGLASGCAWPGKGANERSLAFEPDSIPEAYARSTAALMVPGATRSFQITPAGDLYNGAWRVRIHPAAEGESAAAPRRIAYLDRWLPVAAWTRRSGDVAWRFEAVAFPGPAVRDSGLIASLLVEATNHAAVPRRATLSMSLEPPETDPVFVAWDAPETPWPPLAWGAGAERDTVYAWSAEAPSAQPSATRTTSWSLAAGQTVRHRVLVPAYPMAAAALARLARSAHAARVDQARREWKEALDRGTHFELGDPEVERALDAARVMLLSCRERRGAGWVPIGGPFHYRDVWLRDGARLIAALAVAGHTREARELAEGFMQFRWPQGAFLSQRGQPDGTGEALWTFEQAVLRPAPSESLSRYVAAARQAWQWYEWQRNFGRQAGWALGPLMPYAEPRDAELVRAQLVGTDAWALAGYRATARLMRAAGLEAEAAAVDRSRASYAADFEAALGRTGSRDIPPSWQEVGRDWGNLAVGWPCAALPADHPRLAALARRAWAEAGGAGLVTYGHRDSLHGYVGADLGTWALLAGRRAQADSVLAALLHWRNASGAAAELFSRAGDFGRNLPPHPTSAAALVALVRNALLFDDGDTLALTLGARERWWRGTRVTRAPTRWGLIDLEFHRDGDAASWRWTPVPVWTALTLPPGTFLAGDPPAPLTRGSTTVVLAPPGTREARVAVRAAP